MFRRSPVHFPIRYARLFAPKYPLPPIFFVRLGKGRIIILAALLRRYPDTDSFPTQALCSLVEYFQPFRGATLCTGKTLLIHFERAKVILMYIRIKIERHIPAVVEHEIEIFTRIDLRHAALTKHCVFVHLVACAVCALITRKFGAHGGTLFSRFRREKILCQPSAIITSLFALLKFCLFQCQTHIISIYFLSRFCSVQAHP